MGALLLDCGAEISRVEETMERIAAALASRLQRKHNKKH